MAKALPMVHDVDPRQVIADKLGIKKLDKGIPGIELYGNRVLIAVYERPEKTKSGLILTSKTRNEDAYQGKAGLVLLKGPTAFVSDEHYQFGEQMVNVGDWIAIFVSDGRSITINGQLCRIVEDQHITMRIPEPDIVY